MVKWGLVATVLVLGSVVGGCRTAPPDTRDPFVILQERAQLTLKAGGLAAAGIGTSLSAPLAIEKACARGRAELAQMVETKVDALRKDFAEELGAELPDEDSALFSAAAKNLSHRLLTGTGATWVRSRTEGSLTTAWALVVMSPGTVATAFESEAGIRRELYSRFRESRTFAELKRETKAFETFKRKHAAWLNNH